MCEPIKEGLCICPGKAIVTCICGICIYCGRIRDKKKWKDVNGTKSINTDN